MRVGASKYMIPVRNVDIPQQPQNVRSLESLQGVDHVDAIDVPFVELPDSNVPQVQPNVGQASAVDEFIPATVVDPEILASKKNEPDLNLMLATSAAEYGEDAQQESTIFDMNRYVRNGGFA